MRKVFWSHAGAMLLASGGASTSLAQQQQWVSDGQGGYSDQTGCHYISQNGQWVRNFCTVPQADGTFVTWLAVNGQWQPWYRVSFDPQFFYFMPFAQGTEPYRVNRLTNAPQVFRNGQWLLLPPPPRFDPSVTDPAGAALFGQVGNQIVTMPKAWTERDPPPPNAHH